jgi:hypothetical protein
VGLATGGISNYRSSVVVGAKRLSKVMAWLIAATLFGCVIGGAIDHYVIIPVFGHRATRNVYETIPVYSQFEYEQTTEYLRQLRIMQ